MVACCLAAGCCLKKFDSEVDKLSETSCCGSDQESGEEGSDSERKAGCLCCICYAAQDSFNEIFPDGPVPAGVLAELKEMEGFSKDMAHECGGQTAQDKFDELLNANSDEFQKKQRELNKIIRKAREDATEIVRSKIPGTVVDVASSKRVMMARSSWYG